MLSACVDWLADWTDGLPPIVDEYDLTAWLEAEGCTCLEMLLKTGFRKPRTRQEALEVLRGLVWEWYLAEREKAIADLPSDATAIPRLLGLPQTAQKTAAWYAEARDLLTGHEFAGVVYGTPAAFEAAVAKKCAPSIPVPDTETAEAAAESRTVYCSPLNPFQWGWRYESVIRTLYEEEVADAPVCDTLGRIRHPTLPRLAASPDGLILEGAKAGRLLEIKAPSSRVLTGIIPADYYCQMQLQAEVADVPAVEYVEVRFDSRAAEELVGCAETRRQFLTPTQSKVSPQKPERLGAILVIAPTPPTDDGEMDPETWRYAYSPIGSLDEAGLAEALCWKPADLPAGAVILEHAIWRIQDWWTTTVPRNRRWWSEVGQPAYETFWEAVDAARASGKYLTTTTPPTCLIVDSDEEDEAEQVPIHASNSRKKEVKGSCLIASDSE